MHWDYVAPEDRPLWPGTLGPSRTTPPRAPGSLRRTTTVDLVFHRPLEVTLHGRGRDLLAHHDGTASILDEIATRLEVDFLTRRIVSAHFDPDPGIDTSSLVGLSGGGSFRKALLKVNNERGVTTDLAAQLLDETPVAMVISGASLGRRGLIPDSIQLDEVLATKGAANGVCLGWRTGGVMSRAITDGTRPHLGEGPLAPDLHDAADPLAWHHADALAFGSIRRRRRLDLVAVDRAGVSRAHDVHAQLRDTYFEEDGRETIVHEYEVHARVDDGVLVAASALPRILPGPECGAAAATAGLALGMALADLRLRVSLELGGNRTCTHLNDTLRSIGGLPLDIIGPAPRRP